MADSLLGPKNNIGQAEFSWRPQWRIGTSSSSSGRSAPYGTSGGSSGAVGSKGMKISEEARLANPGIPYSQLLQLVDAATDAAEWLKSQDPSICLTWTEMNAANYVLFWERRKLQQDLRNQHKGRIGVCLDDANHANLHQEPIKYPRVPVRAQPVEEGVNGWRLCEFSFCQKLER